MKRKCFLYAALVSFILLMVAYPPASPLAKGGIKEGWENRCAGKAVPFIRIPHDKESVLSLEARRVLPAKGNEFGYNLGREVITVIPDSFQAEHFIKAVKEGRCGASQVVRLVPEGKSLFNRKFRAESSEKKRL